MQNRKRPNTGGGRGGGSGPRPLLSMNPGARGFGRGRYLFEGLSELSILSFL